MGLHIHDHSNIVTMLQHVPLATPSLNDRLSLVTMTPKVSRSSDHVTSDVMTTSDWSKGSHSFNQP